MSDSPEEFERKMRAQIAGAKGRLHVIADRYLELILVDVVKATPGPGNQSPPDTEYIATGNLRRGYSMGLVDKRGQPATRFEQDGDYGDSLTEPVQAAMSFVRENSEKWNTFYFTNEVAYGVIIMERRGRHANSGHGYWISPIARDSAFYLGRAIEETSGGS